LCLVGLCLVGLAGAARADTVDDLSRKLRGDPDYKVRLSAALNLGKIGDRRAVAPLVGALGDPDRTVRGVAAGALGKIVDSAVAPDVRTSALSALSRMTQTEKDPAAREQAQRAYLAISSSVPISPPPTALPPPLPRNAIYVEVGLMTDTTKKNPTVPAIMRQKAMGALAQGGRELVTRWPTGRSPSASDLSSTGATGFYIDGSLTALTVTGSHVACSVSILLATYPGKSMFAFTKGGAELDSGSSSASSIAEATGDCVGAVIEDMVVTKIVPTIKSRAPGGAP